MGANITATRHVNATALTPPIEPISSRRRLLLAGAIAAAWRAARARADDVPFSPTRWLAQRITFGLTQEELTLADSLGADGYLEYHLNHTTIDDSALDQRLTAYTTLTMQPYQLAPLTNGQFIQACR